MERSAEVLGIGQVVRDVRRRWRFARALRGAALVLGGAFGTLVIVALVVGAFDYSDGALTAGRIAAAIVIALLAAWWIVLPQLRRPRDAQVALYLEEREPSLEGALLTAVESSGAATVRSPALVERLVAEAWRRVTTVERGRRADAPRLRAAWLSVAAVAGLVLAVLVMSPPTLRQAMALLLRPWSDVPVTIRFRIDVEPGDVELPRGGDLLVRATLRGFDAERADVMARATDTSEWMPIAMRRERDTFAARLLDVSAGTEYMVESGGIRSPVYRIVVRDLPAARRVDLEYRFPAYTRLAPQRSDSGGDIAALRGTIVRVRVTPTLPAPAGRLVLDDGRAVPLRPAGDGSLEGLLRLDRSGFYRVELQARDGRMVAGSLEYAVDVLPDRPPAIRFEKPGRDLKVLSVDEVFTDVRAEDDYGIARLDLVYSVNGGPERVVPLSAATARALRDITAGYTFMLEEFALQAGDIVSYYARALDNDAISGAKSASSDIYFLQVRPYAQEYRQSQGGGGGGSGGDESANQLSQKQREIIAGTFRVVRDSAATARAELAANMATLRLSQDRLRDQVRELATRLVARGVAARDSSFRVIAEILPRAAAHMDTATRALAAGRPRDALSPEQRALQQLQHAEAVFREIQVQMGQDGSGGGGSSGAQAQDLADLFELEKDRLRNQFESVQHGQDGTPEASRQVDELAEKLRQLAARQQAEDERARRMADSLAQRGASGSSGAGTEQAMAREAAETARRLERLAREQRSQPLADAARRIQEASDAMRRAAAGQAGEREAARERLQEAQRLLRQDRGGQLQRDLREAAAQARALAGEQRRADEDAARVAGTDPRALAARQAVGERSAAMADQVRQLGQKLDRMAMDNRRSSPAAARQVEEAADTLRSSRLEDKLRVVQMNARHAPPEYLRAMGRSIVGDLEGLAGRLERASQVAAESPPSGDSRDGREAAVEQAGALVRGMRSLDERSRQREESGTSPGAGQQGGPRGAPSDARQFAREIQERLRDARQVQRALARMGIDSPDLAQAIEGMQALAAGGSAGDPGAAAELRARTLDHLQSFEFALRRRMGLAEPGVLLGRAADVPAEYRKQVEAYYRSLAGAPRPR